MRKWESLSGGAIWLDPDKTSAFEFWQFWRNVEDKKVGDFLRLFTEIDMDEITRLECLGGKEINEAKIILATEVTAMVHGRATAEHAATLAVGSQKENAEASTPTHLILEKNFISGLTVAQILFDAGLVKSKTEAAKIAANGGVKLNGNPVSDVRATLTHGDFDGSTFLLSVGKNKIIAVKIVD